MVKEGILSLLAEILNAVKLPAVLDIFIEQLKVFFKYSSHQKEMIRLGILKNLIKNINCAEISTQIKSFDVILQFDGKRKFSSTVLISLFKSGTPNRNDQ
jgi:hypothetical protein